MSRISMFVRLQNFHHDFAAQAVPLVCIQGISGSESFFLTKTYASSVVAIVARATLVIGFTSIYRYYSSTNCNSVVPQLFAEP